MNVLLLSMPDSFEHMPAVAIRMPNGGLSSLAGNVDPHHEVAVADLILVQHRVREVVERLVRERAPDLVGLSVMTFQRKTAQRIIELVRALRPGVRVATGGYDPSLAPDAYTGPSAGAADFIVRGGGELTFRGLRRAIERGRGVGGDAGLNDVEYLVQAMTSAIANHGETLAPLMRRAGFRYVFLGIENILDEDLEFLRASAKNRARENGRSAGNATIKAIESLHRHRMYVVGGLIVG